MAIIKTRPLLTYGEAWGIIAMSDRIDVILPPHRPRMSREDTIIYYSRKFNDYLDNYFKDELPNDRQRINTIRMIATSCVEYRRFCFKK